VDSGCVYSGFDLLQYIGNMISAIIPLIFKLGLTFGAGSSTFALIFYILALDDGVIDKSEKRFMHTVYTVLRIGMTLIILGLALMFFQEGATTSSVYLMQCTLIGVITLNAILMTYRLMPMKYGPVLAGGSWYSLFFTTSLPFGDVEYSTLIFYYIPFLVVFYIVFSFIRRKFAYTKK